MDVKKIHETWKWGLNWILEDKKGNNRGDEETVNENEREKERMKVSLRKKDWNIKKRMTAVNKKEKEMERMKEVPNRKKEIMEKKRNGRENGWEKENDKCCIS